MAPPTSGPRQTMGWPSGTKNWIEMAFTPWRSSGRILLLTLAFGWPSRPSIIGMFGPVMSPSSSPTDAPDWASATARLTLTVLFPTPPLPDATAMMFLTPGTSCSAWRGCGAADHGAPGDVDPGRADPAERGPRRPLDLVLERTGGRRQFDGHRDGRAVDDDVLDHVQGDQVLPELGFLDGPHRIDDGALGDQAHRRGSPSGVGLGF